MLQRSARCILAPRHGQWGPWNPASWEEAQCSNGYKTRSRNCDNPAPAHGGLDCSGNRYVTIDCNECSHGNGGCEQLCVDYDGTYSCRCNPGYKISPGNWKKCDSTWFFFHTLNEEYKLNEPSLLKDTKK